MAKALDGVRILDYLDLHYYPQASGVALATAGTATTQALRLRSTRSLWDPNYTDESWINTKVRLAPKVWSARLNHGKWACSGRLDRSKNA